MNFQYAPRIVNTDTPITPGMSVCLVVDWGTYARGDTGKAVIVRTEDAWVEFDGGAHEVIPLAVLAEHVREFCFRVRGGPLSCAYASEDAASDAASDLGLLEWEIVEIQHVSTVTVVESTEPAPKGVALH